VKNGFIFQVPAVLLQDPRVSEITDCEEKMYSAELQKASGVVGGVRMEIKVERTSTRFYCSKYRKFVPERTVRSKCKRHRCRSLFEL
jgi:hypothetical protein